MGVKRVWSEGVHDDNSDDEKPMKKRDLKAGEKLDKKEWKKPSGSKGDLPLSPKTGDRSRTFLT